MCVLIFIVWQIYPSSKHNWRQYLLKDSQIWPQPHQYFLIFFLDWKVLCRLELNSKVKCWIANFSLKFSLLYLFNLFWQGLLFSSFLSKKILMIKKYSFWCPGKSNHCLYVYIKTIRRAANFLPPGSGTGPQTGLMGLARKSVHKILQSLFDTKLTITLW